MRRFITFFILNCLYVCSLFAAIPKTLSYQAVVRDGSGNLITEKSIGVSISILLEDTSNVVYQEEHVVTTNKYGLISLTIGKESSFSEINWSGGSYFIQCQFDLNKDGFYDLKSCSPMQSVPYALYAENVSPSALPAWVYSEKKPSYSFDELDDKPFIPSRLSELEDDVNFLTVRDLPKQDSSFYESVAYQISSEDTMSWNRKLSVESDPIYSASVASHITSADTLRWNEKLSAESDPIYSESVASHITSADTLKWNEKLSEESDPIYSASVASHITSADTLRWNEKLSEESDPIYSASVASQITSEDTMSWNRKLEISDLKDYAHKGELPIVPTKVSEFENDATYVTQADLSMLAEVVRELTQRVNDLEADNQQINRVVDSLKLETQKLQYKVDSMQAVSNDAIVNYAKTATPVYSFPLDSWTYAYEVYESLKEGDRVVFVVRHSERDEGCSGSECDLNANGINMVKEIGVKFRGGLAGVDDSYYGSSDAERCKTTSYLIATTRGDTHLSSNQDVVNPIEVLKSKYYGEDLNSWPGRAEYYNKNPEEVAQKSMVLVNDLLNRTKGKTFSWFTSHDYVMVPLVEWATNLGIDYEKYKGIYNGEDSEYQNKETDYFYWNNFLSGVAILVHKDNTFEIYPVKNLEDGFRYNRCYKDW